MSDDITLVELWTTTGMKCEGTQVYNTEQYCICYI